LSFVLLRNALSLRRRVSFFRYAVKAAQDIRVFRPIKDNQERQRRTCSGSTPVQGMTLLGAEGFTLCAGVGVEWARPEEIGLPCGLVYRSFLDSCKPSSVGGRRRAFSAQQRHSRHRLGSSLGFTRGMPRTCGMQRLAGGIPAAVDLFAYFGPSESMC
jgi:hypothetical protein